MTCIHHIAEAVHAVREAKKRIPDSLKDHSFFGALDFWRFVPEFDDRRCPECTAHWQTYFFTGDSLRGTFDHLEIQDENTISPKVHPNCRCQLWRVTTAQYDLVYRYFYGEKPQ